jgi:protein-tyrosine phosphatase
MPWLSRSRPRQAIDVLVVCTGNVCRSPYIAAVLQHALPELRVSSAGTAALTGQFPDEHVRRALAERALDAELQPARRLNRRLVSDAQLVITATRLHRAQVVDLQPAAAERAFTLKELARVIEPQDRGLAAVIARADAAAREADPVDYDDDLDDPFRLEWPAYEHMASEVDAALAVIVPALREGPATA